MLIYSHSVDFTGLSKKLITGCPKSNLNLNAIKSAYVTSCHCYGLRPDEGALKMQEFLPLTSWNFVLNADQNMDMVICNGESAEVV